MKKSLPIQIMRFTTSSITMCIYTSEIPEIEVSYIKSSRLTERIKLNSSCEAYDLLISKRNINTIELFEEFKVLYLDNNNNVLGLRDLTRGNSRCTIIDYKLLFSIALLSNSAGIIISHNHPSGDLKPSREDIGITDRIQEIGKLMNVKLLDHLIITSRGYYCFRDEGTL